MRLNLTMHKILLITMRDYIAVVRTKAFIIGMLLVPLLSAANFLVVALMNRSDISDKRIVVVDRTGLAADAVINSLRKQNERELFDKTTKVQIIPRYQFENLPPNASAPDLQRLTLSDMIRRREIYAFVEIGDKALEPNRNAAGDAAGDSIHWYSSSNITGQWIATAINDGLRQVKLARTGVAPNQFEDVLTSVPLKMMNLVSRDEKTGRIEEAREKGVVEFLIPFGIVSILFMTVILTSSPMMSAIVEDKMQRVFEMLLVSATPFELIAGKILAAVGRSLTSAIFYIATAIFLIYGGVMTGVMKPSVLPWFLIYLIAQVTVMCALASALGAACSSPQDANGFAFILIIPMMLPVLMVFPVIMEPNGSLAIAMSMFPLFTPILMLARQLSPEVIPAWQPWVGLVGVAITTVLISWFASRIFRIGILLQGKQPKLSDIIRWGVKG